MAVGSRGLSCLAPWQEGRIGSVAAYVSSPRQCRLLGLAACAYALAAAPFFGAPTHLSDEPYYRQSQGGYPGQ